MILVDSTRAGKKIPDALSKTVPIWCAVINRALLIRFPEYYSQLRGTWNAKLYTPPGTVSAQEHDQIEKKLDGWSEALAVSLYSISRSSLPDIETRHRLLTSRRYPIPYAPCGSHQEPQFIQTFPLPTTKNVSFLSSASRRHGKSTKASRGEHQVSLMFKVRATIMNFGERFETQSPISHFQPLTSYSFAGFRPCLVLVQLYPTPLCKPGRSTKTDRRDGTSRGK